MVAWIALLVAYAGAWWLPVSWWFQLTPHGSPVPPGIDGPVSWVWRWWTDPESPTAFQWLVAPAALWIASTRGATAWAAWQQTLATPSAILGRWQRFRWAPLSVAFLLLAIGHLTHVATIATLGLAFAPWAVLRATFGPLVARSLAPAWGCMLLLAMPPETLLARLNEIGGTFVAHSAAVTGRSMGMSIEATGWTLRHGLRVLPLPRSGGAVATCLIAVFATWVHGIAMRRPNGVIAMRSAMAFVFAFTASTIRALCLATFPGPVASGIAAFPLIVCSPLFVLAPGPILFMASRARVQIHAPVAALFRGLRRVSGRWLSPLARRIRPSTTRWKRRSALVFRTLDRWAEVATIPFRLFGRTAEFTIASLERGLRVLGRRKPGKKGGAG